MTILYADNVDAAQTAAIHAQPGNFEEAHRGRIQKNAKIFYGLMHDHKEDHRLKRYNIDSSDFGAKAFEFARDLEHIYNEVLREQYAPNNGLDLFHIDSRPRPGAKTHTVRRISHTGKARYYRSNASDMGSTGVQKTEKSFPIHPIVTSISFDFFEQLSSGFANSGLQEELSIAAYQTIRDFKNEKTFFGDEEMGVRGILNYDFTPKTFSLVDFNTSSDASAVLAELHRQANNATIISKQVHSPNRLIVGTRKYLYLTTTKVPDTDGSTILKEFLKDSPYIQTVVPIHEFDDAGPNGMDVMFFDRANDARSISNVIPTAFSMLPIQQTGFQFEIPCYMLDGGIISRDPLNNLIVYVN